MEKMLKKHLNVYSKKQLKIILKKKEKNEKKGELLQSDENGENINLDFNNKDINDIKKKKCCINF